MNSYRGSLIKEKNDCFSQLKKLQSFMDFYKKGEAVFMDGNIDDLENNILYYLDCIKEIDRKLREMSEN